ncbi:MAG: ATP-binding protein [Bacteroidales bacterium]|nr:ATP-binding protein [Bacteroidales bacterium]
MKRIIIRDLGPITKADILLKDINVVIGEQSIGKSCVLKVSCFCTWVEKRIAIEQNARRFEKKGVFLEELVNFHRLNGYIHENTYIGYESDFIKFSYDNEHGFSYEWKNDRWEYKRPKVSYIPAERNLVAVIPNWFEVKSVAENIQDFMADWADARKTVVDKDILNLDVVYHYDESNDTDFVRTKDGQVLPFTNVSSGLQSLIPLYIHLVNINSKKYREREDNSVKHKSEMENLADLLVDYYENNIGKAFIKNPKYGAINQDTNLEKKIITNPEMTEWLVKNFLNISKIHHCEVFLEEPEENLFPPTQQILMKTLLNQIKQQNGNTLFISTHSPYILDVLLEREQYDFGLFYIRSAENGSEVKTATEADVQDMFEGGVDAFFNIERLGDEV